MKKYKVKVLKERIDDNIYFSNDINIDLWTNNGWEIAGDMKVITDRHGSNYLLIPIKREIQ